MMAGPAGRLGPMVAVIVTVAVGAGIALAQTLAVPQIRLAGIEPYEAGGRQWTRYRIAVTNRSQFPDELFNMAPTLPPCGRNASASRTWVDIHDEAGARLYSFCALRSAADLDRLWFAVERSQLPPARVYVVLDDRQTRRAYTSNLLRIR